jgi:hypothetical protein
VSVIVLYSPEEVEEEEETRETRRYPTETHFLELRFAEAPVVSEGKFVSADKSSLDIRTTQHNPILIGCCIFT